MVTREIVAGRSAAAVCRAFASAAVAVAHAVAVAATAIDGTTPITDALVAGGAGTRWHAVTAVGRANIVAADDVKDEIGSW